MTEAHAAEPHQAEPLTAAYLARRGVAPQWRLFVRGLVETLDEHLDSAGRAALLRAIGRRMADAMPLPHCDTLKALESHINDALGAAEWGYCQLAVDVEARRLLVTHAAAPAIGAGEDADGGWIGAVLEGLYGGWLSQQPGADADLAPSVFVYAPGEAKLGYGRAA
ncbi:cellulose biosynthesis protein BcsD [Falsiroseomonas tokyonensis]|uniref:Cellulose biosynthesis protein BcsD n=1 Tax=Falsiroseomonas tokyonensis TaxID=430521 RepID=A0ABV7BLI6_9PROT|nr:cellulose biosynthesis protein BcsD [Falsiroseomonas tokyonensis]MBU8536436.1 hypothetical protein [Falsiroseomonas tokyonensis]